MSKPPQRPPHSSQIPTPPRSTGAVPPAVERALALRDVMNHAVRVQKETTAPKRLRPSRARLIGASVLCVPLIALSLYSWIARPEFIWGPKPRAVSPQRREASLRVSMFLLAKRIESYRKAGGGYPRSLDLFGAGTDGISYRVASDSEFELRATQDGKAIVFRSHDNPAEFLGNSPTVLQGVTK